MPQCGKCAVAATCDFYKALPAAARPKPGEAAPNAARAARRRDRAMNLRPLALAAALLLAAAAAAADQPALRLVDDGGHEVALAHPARRIVALAPHLTELVYAAGAGDQLVAVGKFSDFPPEAKSKPVISDAFAVNYEALAQLKPDLVLVWGSGTPERIKAKLRSLGVPVYEIEIRSVAGLADTLRSIGRLAGTEGVAQARAQAITNDWAALQADLRRPQAGARVLRAVGRAADDAQQPAPDLQRDHGLRRQQRVRRAVRR